LRLHILGANSAIPTSDRFSSCQCLDIDGNISMIDCGEGAQINLTKYKIKRSKINQIFISHLHGDHIYGLPGLLSSLSLSERTHPLQVYGPAGIEGFLKSVMKYSYLVPRFAIEIIQLPEGHNETVYENQKFAVDCFPLIHRVPTFGYKFRTKQLRPKLDKDVISKYHLSVDQIKSALEGFDLISEDGTVIKNSKITIPKGKGKSYAYCSDTIYHEGLCTHVNEVDVLYHEATYMHDMKVQAAERFHSTTIQASTIAKDAKVKQLIIGHFSSRYKNLEPLLLESRSVFTNTELAEQGRLFEF